MPQVELKISKKTVAEIDKWVREGRFKSRSDAIKTIIAFYQEREKMLGCYKMLFERRKEIDERPGLLVPLEELK